MTDRKLINKSRLVAIIERLGGSPSNGAEFLLERMCVDLQDRLAAHTRKFENGSLVCPWEDYSGLKRLGLKLAPRSTWIDELYAFPSRSQDLIVDLANLHRVNDVPGMLIQYRRALRPDGLFLACLPGGDSLHELRQSLTHAEVSLSGGVHPRILPFMDVRDAGGLLQRAGFALPVADVDSVVVRYDTMFDLMIDLRAMGETNVLSASKKSFSTRSLFERAAEYYVENFSDDDGRIRATFSLVWMSGWAPDISQQKPLKPGSATHRLADVLKGKEE